MKDSIMIQKASDFAVAIIELNKVLLKKKEYEISGQIKRSGTAIGALICEAQFAESLADFIHKMRIALKECHETEYWLNLLHRTHYIADNQYKELLERNTALKRMLIASINTKNRNLESSK